MTERYWIAKESILEGCLVTPDVYKGVLERFDEFVAVFVEHLNVRTPRQKATDDMKGLISDTERKNVESIAYYHGSDRQPLQKFIGQVDWDDEIILDKLVDRIKREIGPKNGVLILDPTSFPKKGKQRVGVRRQWWHHHVALSMLSPWFLTAELMRQKKRTDDDDSASAGLLRRGVEQGAIENLFSGRICLLSKYAIA